MAYQSSKGPMGYKGYGQKKKTGLNLRIRKTGILLILLAGGLLFWLVTGDVENKKEDISLPGIPFAQERKNIYDRYMEPLAVSFDLYAAYVKPLEVDDSGQAGEILAAAFGLDREQLIKRIRTERSFIWLGHQVPPDKVAELSKRNIAGLYFQKSPVRFYPHYKTAAQVLGYVKDEQGLTGIELFYDKELMGRTLKGGAAGLGKQTFNAGTHIVLTLDLKTQTILEKQMTLLLDKTRARSVAAMAVDPATGEIVASVQLPSFDPNSFWDATPQSQQMDMISRAMNPGGISAIFRYGAAIHASQNSGTPSAQSPPVNVRPRGQNSAAQSRGGHWWLWPGGGFISGELAELPDPTITEAELLAFQHDLGIGCADQVDMPVTAEAAGAGEECDEGRLNGVSILGAFSRLVNGGKPVALHFMKGTVDTGGNFSSVQFKAPGRDVAKVSAVLKKSFAASAGENTRFFGAEYLLRLEKEDEFIVESQEGNQSSEVFNSGQVFDGMLVAASPAENPRLVLLVSVKSGDFDLSAASPMRRFGDAFLRQVTKEMLTTPERDLTSKALAGEERLLSDWLKQHKVGIEEQKVAERTVGKIPNVVGMSLRKALLELTPCRVEIEIDGAGRVVAQDPAPGKECGSKIHLKLATGHGGTKQ